MAAAKWKLVNPAVYMIIACFVIAIHFLRRGLVSMQFWGVGIGLVRLSNRCRSFLHG